MYHHATTTTNGTSNPIPKSSKNNSNARAQWTQQQTTIFCEPCVYEVGWRNIEAAFKKNTIKAYPGLKYKYKWDTMKTNLIWLPLDTLQGTFGLP